MIIKRLLLLSSSTKDGEPYLEYPQSAIKDFLGREVKRVLFVPFAGVRLSYHDYAAMVREHFEEMGYFLDSVHERADAAAMAREAEAIAIGGGNTFHLLHALYETGLLELIRERVEAGLPYIGWSAGSNVACPTIKTTNDMPIIEPVSFKALDLVPFQLNPHYTDEHPAGHRGETRAQRIEEFTLVNPNVYVVGLREGSMLRVEGSSVRLLGEKSARLFIKGAEVRDYEPSEPLDFLLQ